MTQRTESVSGAEAETRTYPLPAAEVRLTASTISVGTSAYAPPRAVDLNDIDSREFPSETRSYGVLSAIGAEIFALLVAALVSVGLIASALISGDDDGAAFMLLPFAASVLGIVFIVLAARLRLRRP